MRLHWKFLFLTSALISVLAGCVWRNDTKISGAWRGVHFWLDSDTHARELAAVLPALSRAGVNIVVIEVNYSYEFRQHPELRQETYVTRQTARRLAAVARNCHIQLVPEFNCLGHQTFGRRVEPLLKMHPEFSETSLATMRQTNFYSLSWCPLAPGLDATVFDLIDEIADGFQTDAIHVGMDEVYYIADDRCPRCRGKNPAELFAAQVNTLHQHIVGEKHWQMLMWADRVIGTKFQGASRYDNPRNDTSACADLIPRDIVMCDWHYEWRKEYPSIAFLAGKGFRVWPAGFLPLKAARQLSEFSLAQRTNVVGYLATTWNQTSIADAPEWPPIREVLLQWK
jgi:hypothetical protein